MEILQRDLFELDSPLYADVHGERTVAEFPFFALSKRPQMTPMVFENGSARIEINPSKTGVATIYDKEILLYIASLMAERMERGEKVERVMSFTANDLFRVTSTNPSARSYDMLKDSLARLQGTQIITNIETGGEGSDSAFSWLLKAEIKYIKSTNGGRRVKKIEVMVCDWLYRAILQDKRIAAYHLGFFQLGPIERRLYELAKFNCLDDADFEVDLETLAARVGCATDKRGLENLKKQIRVVADTQSLPEYEVRLSEEQMPSSGRGRPKIKTTVHFSSIPISQLDTMTLPLFD
ncbi:RepB family plasmid replication initiator protein (plasmid) [Sphingobium yanoikuyae]|uniref:RepB family plasmid replication initiator protein n=1 Tax=Sphingobium yanoikuyae TaxID=13690 RepID=A0A6P1GRY8_SPHYA|nr:replication initiator protein A [Sphingobium yanoikuyae]QHD70652.1 RepB family plasmid replication initiator protein [Sphingobium yanoikuyae]